MKLEYMFTNSHITYTYLYRSAAAHALRLQLLRVENLKCSMDQMTYTRNWKQSMNKFEQRADKCTGIIMII